MKPTGFKKNFLCFYLDPELYSTEEAEEALKKKGVNIRLLKEKGTNFKQMLEAKKSLKESGKKKAEFLTILEQFKKEDSEIELDNLAIDYKIAARKKDSSQQEKNGATDDAKLLEYIRNKKN